MTSLATLPNFLLYFGTSVALFAGFLMAYTMVLPLREWRLIRQGNTAVALTLGGAIIGFAMPLAMAIIRSGNLADMAVWAVVALLLQLLCFGAMRLLRRDASTALARGDMAEAVLLTAGSVRRVGRSRHDQRRLPHLTIPGRSRPWPSCSPFRVRHGRGERFRV